MRATWGRRFLLAIMAVLLGTVSLGVGVSPARADEPVKVLLLLDVSGSMNEPIASGGTKFAAAKRALKDVAKALPAGTNVGLRVYGSKISAPKSENPKACTDTDLVLPIGPLDPSKMNRAVDSFKAKGETPIAYSLGKAVDDLGTSGKRVVVLISDGEETCAKNPCPTAEKLAKSGVDLQFNAIGLAVGSKARKQLQCIADAGDGTYYDASRTGDLTEALRKITQRALRPFQFSGTAITGTTSTKSAPTMPPGQYTDKYAADSKVRYYQIPRTPGSTVTASIASLISSTKGQGLGSFNLELKTSTGARCAVETVNASSTGATAVLSGAISSGAGFTSVAGQPPPECLSEPNLLLSVQRETVLGARKTGPVEMVVAEEPEITNLGSLPKGVTGYKGDSKAVKSTSPRKPVVGGSAFSNAPLITPGSWTDTLANGETTFYRVHVETGQKVRASVIAPAPGTKSQLGSASAVSLGVDVLAPLRTPLVHNYAVVQGGNRTTVSAASPVVRVRNREAPWAAFGLDQASVAGDYYIAVQLDPAQADLTGRVMTIRLNVTVDGKATGQPQYAEASASASPATPAPSNSTTGSTAPTAPASAAPSTPAESGGRSSVWPLVAVAGAVVVVLGIAIAALRRRRR